MASQGGTRYEDRTMGRGGAAHNNHANNSHNYSVSVVAKSAKFLRFTMSSFQADSVPMENLSLYSSGAGGRMFPPGQHMVSWWKMTFSTPSPSFNQESALSMGPSSWHSPSNTEQYWDLRPSLD